MTEDELPQSRGADEGLAEDDRAELIETDQAKEAHPTAEAQRAVDVELVEQARAAGFVGPCGACQTE